jgi:hypothetical protein
MLRASIRNAGTEYDFSSITGKVRGDGGIPHAQLLADFGEAITVRNREKTAELRVELIEAVGEAGMVDAAGVAAAFHGNVRVADATGAPAPLRGDIEKAKAFQAKVGINEFYQARNG